MLRRRLHPLCWLSDRARALPVTQMTSHFRTQSLPDPSCPGGPVRGVGKGTSVVLTRRSSPVRLVPGRAFWSISGMPLSRRRTRRGNIITNWSSSCAVPYRKRRNDGWDNILPTRPPQAWRLSVVGTALSGKNDVNLRSVTHCHDDDDGSTIRVTGSQRECPPTIALVIAQRFMHMFRHWLVFDDVRLLEVLTAGLLSDGIGGWAVSSSERPTRYRMTCTRTVYNESEESDSYRVSTPSKRAVLP
jgi:hypothetical protein